MTNRISILKLFPKFSSASKWGNVNEKEGVCLQKEFSDYIELKVFAPGQEQTVNIEKRCLKHCKYFYHDGVLQTNIIYFQYIFDFKISYFDILQKFVKYYESTEWKPCQKDSGRRQSSEMTQWELDTWGSMPLFELHKLTLFANHLGFIDMIASICLEIAKRIEPYSAEQLKVMYPEIFNYGKSTI